MTYLYGEKGVVGFNYDGADYYYRKNLFGDVLAIYDTAGTVVASYEYDAWGRVLYADNKTSQKIADINPIRYRSYYYDVETELYYLESRYYDPVVGRFLTPDSIDYLGDGEDLNNYNLFAYCSNNPIMYRDPSGHLHVIIGAIAWATVSFGSSILSDILAGESIDWWGALFSAGLGAVSGVLSSASLGPAIQFLGGAILSAAENLIKEGKKDGFENINYIDVSINALLDGVFSIGNGLSKTASKHLKAQYRQMKRRIFKQIKFKGAFEALKEMKPAVTYYLKQTSTLFYKPLMRDIEKEILSFFCEHKTIENT